MSSSASALEAVTSSGTPQSVSLRCSKTHEEVMPTAHATSPRCHEHAPASWTDLGSTLCSPCRGCGGFWAVQLHLIPNALSMMAFSWPPEKSPRFPASSKAIAQSVQELRLQATRNSWCAAKVCRSSSSEAHMSGAKSSSLQAHGGAVFRKLLQHVNGSCYIHP